MTAIRRFAAGLLVMAALPVWGQADAAAAQGKAETARDLVRDTIYNELHDRERDSHWEYRSACVSLTRNIVREQVETDEGPVFRILEQDGAPLDAEQQEREEERLDAYVRDPAQIGRVLRAHEEDEARLTEAMEMLPRAFLFEYEGQPAGDTARIEFRPDPKFAPTGYEARIVHALTGTMIVNQRLKRMIDMRGTLEERVDFGYGILGSVEKGGTFEIHRRQVSAEHWKTDLVDVHIQGRVLMLKTIGKDQREARSDFRPVPGGTTPAEAKNLLEQAAQTTQAELETAPAGARAAER